MKLICLIFISSWSLAGDTEKVVLSLDQFKALEKRIEDRKQALPSRVLPPTEQKVTVRVENDQVTMESRFRFDARDFERAAFEAPLAGLVQEIRTDSAEHLIMKHQTSGIVFETYKPEILDVTVVSLIKMKDGLKLPLFKAPMSMLELDVPEQFDWVGKGTIMEKRAEEGRLKLAVIPEPNIVSKLVLDPKTGNPDELLAHTVVVTALKNQGYRISRRDAVLYDVALGKVGDYVMTLPEELGVNRAVTNERWNKEAVTVRKGNTLTVQRKAKAEGWSYATLESELKPQENLSLPMIQPRVPVRSRFLVLEQGAPAELTPQPEELWGRVDESDLPDQASKAILGLKVSAVWRFLGDSQQVSARLQTWESVDTRKTLILERDTTSNLDLDGKLYTRDVFEIRAYHPTFDLELPEGVALASATIDGSDVRPVVRGRKLLFSLPLDEDDIPITLELATTREGISTVRNARITLESVRVSEQVLQHSWQFYLPESSQWEVSQSTLAPIPEAQRRQTVIACTADPSLNNSDVILLSQSGKKLKAGRIRLGELRFEDIPAGQYFIEVSGHNLRFGPFKIKKGKTRKVHLRKAPEKTTHMLDAVEFMDTSKVGQVEVLTDEELNNVPQSRDPWATIMSIPGIQSDRINVGGSEAGSQNSVFSAGPTAIKVDIPKELTGELLELFDVLPPERIQLELRFK